MTTVYHVGEAQIAGVVQKEIFQQAQAESAKLLFLPTLGTPVLAWPMEWGWVRASATQGGLPEVIVVSLASSHVTSWCIHNSLGR